MEDSGHAWISTAIIEDTDLTPYAFRVYAIIRAHDFGQGKGCYLSRASIATAGKMSEAQVIRSLRELRDKGYIVTQMSADGQHPNTHYCTEGGVCETPVITKRGGVSQTRVSHSKRGGVSQTPKVDYIEVNNPPSNEGGADAPRADAQPSADTLPPAQERPTGPRTEQPQYRVFLALCTAAGSTPADMEGHKGTACANAAKALKLLTARYADEGHVDPAGAAEADLCAMVAWKVLDYRRENRRKRGLPPAMVWMAYQDMAAWKDAGSPGRVQTTQTAPRRNGPGRIYDPTLDPGHRAAMAAMEAKWAASPCNPANQTR